MIRAPREHLENSIHPFKLNPDTVCYNFAYDEFRPWAAVR
jgi:hypothetical protein